MQYAVPQNTRLLLEEFCNIIHQGGFAGSTQDEVPDTDHRNSKFVLFEKASLIQVAAIGHDTAV